MKLFCILGLHKWLYNQCPIFIGASRECVRCGKSQKAYHKDNILWLRR